MTRVTGSLTVLLYLAVLVAPSCAGARSRAQPSSSAHDRQGRRPGSEVPALSPLAEEAVRGVIDDRLRGLLADHWELWMKTSPVWATTVGDHRYDDRLPDNSPRAIGEEQDARRGLLERAAAIPRSSLAPGDQTTFDLLVEELEAELASARACRFHLWSVGPREGMNPAIRFNRLSEEHRLDTPRDGENFLARYRMIPVYIDQAIANLRAGLSQGLVGNAESIQRTIDLVRRQLARPVEEWELMEPALSPPAQWHNKEQRSFANAVAATVRSEIQPAVARYARFLADELLPRARGPKWVGVASMPGGLACYQAEIRRYLAVERSAPELHRLGVAEIKRINGLMRQLGRGLFATEDLGEILARLRGDPSLFFTNADEILAQANKSLADAKAAVGNAFGIFPKTDCVVVAIPDYEAPFTTIAYYREPHYDGSKPGEYFVNTYEPSTRPRYEAQVLAYHESIPGHHFQIALAMERQDIPAFRRFLGVGAFVEGWALYSERLAGELGLYRGDLDRLGALSYEAWRAARLVVDTGIHAMGWTRERAEQYLREHTALAENNIRNEVDRYVTWPGQALAYKVGQLEILRLRDRARAELGDRFDLRQFHDTVLAQGALTLPILAGQIETWIERRRRSVSRPAPRESPGSETRP